MALSKAAHRRLNGRIRSCRAVRASVARQRCTRGNKGAAEKFTLGSRVAITALLLTVCGGCKARRPAAITPQMDVAAEFLVRVLIADDVSACKLKGRSALNVIGGRADSEETSEAMRFGDSKAEMDVTISRGSITVGGRRFPGDELTVCPDRPHIFALNGKEYRGKLRIVVNPGRTSFDAINMIPLEPYLAGVIGAEMPDYWEPEALKAQTIAARTYCLYIKRRFGGGRSWDIKKTQAHQVYRGLAAESAQIWNAVDNTRAKVMTCRQTDKSEDIFPAYYSSTCGGHTESSENVFGDSFVPLSGVACPYCERVARPKFFFWPMVQFGTVEVTKKLAQQYPKLKEIGEIVEMTPTGKSEYEGFTRLTRIKLSGSTGRSDFLRAEDLRLTIDPTGRRLKSTIFEIMKLGNNWAFSGGRGYGHGVGMCQCGAQALARQGKKAEQILAYYYPGSRIVSVY
ncbi:MAG: SpoIID/LytB domain-containing protein [Phycisphaerales bacterium]|nr:MAG: SpoIID/LytB domain-containing protein [Phycisphaerales bacterium]